MRYEPVYEPHERRLVNRAREIRKEGTAHQRKMTRHIVKMKQADLPFRVIGPELGISSATAARLFRAETQNKQ